MAAEREPWRPCDVRMVRPYRLADLGDPEPPRPRRSDREPPDESGDLFEVVG